MFDSESINEAEFLSACGDAPGSQFGECATWSEEESDHGYTATQSLVTALEENPWESEDEVEPTRARRELDSASQTHANGNVRRAERMPGAFPGDENEMEDATIHPTSDGIYDLHRSSARQEELLSGMGVSGPANSSTAYPPTIAEGADILILEQNRWETETAISEVKSEPPGREAVSHHSDPWPRSATNGNAQLPATGRHSAISFEEPPRHLRHGQEPVSRTRHTPRTPRSHRSSKRKNGGSAYIQPIPPWPVPEASRRNESRTRRVSTPDTSQANIQETKPSIPLTGERSGGHEYSPRQRRRRRASSPKGSTVRSDSCSRSPRFHRRIRVQTSDDESDPRYAGFCWGWRPWRRGR